MTELSARGRRVVLYLTILLITLLLVAGCGRSKPAPTPTPIPPTATPTALPPTATPMPETATDGAASTETVTEAEATPVPTPVVTIPDGFTVKTDDTLGYSLALPSNWTEFDLRSERIQSMAGTFGFADQIAPLIEFLDTPDGQAVGMVAMTDLAGVMFGGVPTLLNVSVVDSPRATPDSVLNAVQGTIEANASSLGDVQIESLEATTVNNLPAVQGTAIVDLSSYGIDKQLYAKFVGLIANDKIYALTLATDVNKQVDNEAVFDEIIGSYRPE